MSAHTPTPWLRAGNTIYTLMSDGWSKGVEEFRNRFYFSVYADRSCSAEEIEKTIASIAPSLNSHDALVALANNFEITGPDDDGLMWLVLHGNGTIWKAMLNLGKPTRIVSQVMLALEQDRRAALAAAGAA